MKLNAHQVALLDEDVKSAVDFASRILARPLPQLEHANLRAMSAQLTQGLASLNMLIGSLEIPVYPPAKD